MTSAQNAVSAGKSKIQAGHSFEDATSQLVYSHAKECGLRAHPARQTLSIPTRSGNSYQFDASFAHGDTIYLVECKRRQISAVEHVYYFGSKVLDHHIVSRGKGLHVKGIFLSSVEVGKSSMQFGLAFGMRILDPSNPPLEELYARSENNEPVHRAVRKLWELVESVDPLRPQPGTSPQSLLKSYEFLKRRALDLH